MSLTTEAPTTQGTPAHAVGDMYMQYAIANLACHEGVSGDVTGEDYFQASVRLVRQWRDERDGYDNAAPTVTREEIAELPGERTVDIFHRNTLLTAWDLVSGRDEQVADETASTVRINEAERALDLCEVINAGDMREPRLLKQALGGACITALLNRNEGVAMPFMPHQNLNFRRDPHSGVLLRSNGKTRDQRYGVIYTCGGFTEAHADGDTDPQKAFLKRYVKQVRVLSVCCDLRIDDRDGRRALPTILDAMQREIDNEETRQDRVLLDMLGRRLTGAILGDSSRRGRRQVRQ